MVARRTAGVKQARGSRSAASGLRLLARLRAWLDRQLSSRPLGQRGESAAARFLRRKGYTLISRSQRDRLGGEIDIIAVDGRTVVFVEVKTRRSPDRGHPAESVDYRKQRQLTRLALSYLKRHELLENPARFDVVAVTWPHGKRRPTIEHVPHAFRAVGSGQMFR